MHILAQPEVGGVDINQPHIGIPPSGYVGMIYIRKSTSTPPQTESGGENLVLPPPK